MSSLLNPILPTAHFIPDCEPRVFGDRIYLYGSHDIYGSKYLCMGDYEVWSAPVDFFLEDGAWRCDGISYRREQDPYLRIIIQSGKMNLLNCAMYAPDVICVDNHYWLYYGIAMSGSGIGVAVSDTPTGPFEYVGRVRYPDSAKPTEWKDIYDGIADGDMAFGYGIPMIQPNPLKSHFGINMKDYPYDPALLYDDGHLYLYYGVGYCYMVELETSDMRTVIKNKTTAKYSTESLLPSANNKKDAAAIAFQNGWHMGNGSSIRRIGEVYYLSYYAVKKGCHAICYSYSRSPFGPFHWGGVLVSLGDGDKHLPSAWPGNTHGGLFTVDSRYYLCYHRQTGSSRTGRQTCLAELPFTNSLETGNPVFGTAQFTSQILINGGSTAYSLWSAASTCYLTDKKYCTNPQKAPLLTLSDFNTQIVSRLRDGNIVGFKYLDFSTGCSVTSSPFCPVSIEISLVCPGNGNILVRLDDPANGLIIAQIDTRYDLQKPLHKFGSKVIAAISGIHSVYFIFHGQSKKTQFVSFSFIESQI